LPIADLGAQLTANNQNLIIDRGEILQKADELRFFSEPQEKHESQTFSSTDGFKLMISLNRRRTPNQSKNWFNKLCIFITMSELQIISTNPIPIIDRKVNLKKKERIWIECYEGVKVLLPGKCQQARILGVPGLFSE